jgi:hypothetical protein
MFTSNEPSRQLTSCSQILLEKPIVALTQEIHSNLQVVYYCVHELITGHILRKILVNPAHIPCPLSLRLILILSYVCLGLFPSGFPAETLYAPLSHVFYISYPSHLYLVRSTGYEVPHYAVIISLLLFHPF